MLPLCMETLAGWTHNRPAPKQFEIKKQENCNNLLLTFAADPIK